MLLFCGRCLFALWQESTRSPELSKLSSHPGQVLLGHQKPQFVEACPRNHLAGDSLVCILCCCTLTRGMPLQISKSALLQVLEGCLELVPQFAVFPQDQAPEALPVARVQRYGTNCDVCFTQRSGLALSGHIQTQFILLQ